MSWELPPEQACNHLIIIIEPLHQICAEHNVKAISPPSPFTSNNENLSNFLLIRSNDKNRQQEEKQSMKYRSTKPLCLA